jgi:hypothetical protein
MDVFFLFFFYIFTWIGEEMNASETQSVKDLISFIKEKQENFQEAQEVFI